MLARLAAAPAFEAGFLGPARDLPAAGSGARIEKASLALLFGGIAFNWMSSYLFASTSIEMPEWVTTRFYLYICIPALIFSARSYSRFGGFAKTPALLSCVGLLLAGLTWTPESELGRGLLKFAGFAITVPIASLLVKHDYTRACIQWFAWGTTASLALALTLGGYSSTSRFGTLIDSAGQAVSNPNSVGAQAALATCLLAFLHTHRSAAIPSLSAAGRLWVPGLQRLYSAAAAGAILFLAYSVLMSASRTAFIALTGTLLWSIALRCRQSPSTLIWAGLALAFSLSILWAADSIAIDVNNEIYSQLRSRLFRDEEGTVGSLGSRTLIWKFAGGLLTEDYRWVAGFGTGGVDKTLGSFFELGLFTVGRDGIRRLYAHNTFVDWALMFGFVGALIPAWLGIRVSRTALQMDLEENTAGRTSLVVFAALFSFGGVVTTEVFWIAFGSLLWAMLTPNGSGRLGRRLPRGED